jgi:hypothetical protein
MVSPLLINEKSVNSVHALVDKRSLQSALAQLAHADACARNAQCNPWEFAVEIGSLTAEGLTTSDLRWLIRKGYLEHAHEITRANDKSRRFQLSKNLAFSQRTCFILTESGIHLAFNPEPEPPMPPSRPLGPNRNKFDNLNRLQSVPSWDRDRRVLRFDGCIVKQFKVPSPSQEAVLTAFEEECWPVAIDDPLPPHSQQDSKRRLRNTIQSLNANQKNPLIHFSGNGSGERILWELAQQQADNLKIKGLENIRAA